MENYAIAIANEFVKIAKEKKIMDAPKLTCLRLMKLTYIAHGFILALLNQDVYGAKRDKVEAWKYGPVFPSVYYQFKKKKGDEIRDYAVILKYEVGADDNVKVWDESPKLVDADKKAICEAVWSRYRNTSDEQLVDMLHEEGTPWREVYEEGKCIVIPDAYTKKYYMDLVNQIRG